MTVLDTIIDVYEQSEREENLTINGISYVELREELDRLRHSEQKLLALQDQIDNEGCVVAHYGERTYECRTDKLCGLCVLRGERDKFKQRLLDLGVDPETGKRIPEGCIASDALDTFQEFAEKYSDDPDAARILMSCLRGECEHYGTKECELCGDELES